MGGFLFRCPNTGQLVQGWSAEEIPAEEDGYEFVTCLACTQLHFVNRAQSAWIRGSQVDRRRSRSLPIPPPAGKEKEPSRPCRHLA